MTRALTPGDELRVWRRDDDKFASLVTRRCMSLWSLTVRCEQELWLKPYTADAGREPADLAQQIAVAMGRLLPQTIARTTPPSTRRAAPLVADASGLHT